MNLKIKPTTRRLLTLLTILPSAILIFGTLYMLEQTGAKIIAVERGSEIIIEFNADFRLRADDSLYLCGSLNSIERYQKEFHASPVQSKNQKG